MQDIILILVLGAGVYFGYMRMLRRTHRIEQAQEEFERMHEELVEKVARMGDLASYPNPAADARLRLVQGLDGLIDWLAIQRDPGLWRAVVTGLDYGRKESTDAIAWILQQPDCENAVAAAAMQMLRYDVYCGMDTEPGPQDRAFPLVRIIAERNATTGFDSEKLSDPPDFERASLLTACRAGNAQLKAAGSVPIIPAPLATLLVKPIGPKPTSPYIVGETGIYERR